MKETPSRRLTLPKSCKLRHRSLVEPLFSGGKGVYDFPLRIVWRPLGDEELKDSFRDHIPDRIGALQMMITVPKKKRRHAVDRVLMRRRIREAFRLHRGDLCEAVSRSKEIRTLSMAIIYQSNENLPFSKIEKSMIHLLSKISRRLFEPKGEAAPTVAEVNNSYSVPQETKP